MLHLRLLLHLSLQLLMIRVKIYKSFSFGKGGVIFPITNPCVSTALHNSCYLRYIKSSDKSDDQLLDEMMSSERGECSPIPGLFIDDDTHVL